jgi:hypothetical protein
MKRRKTRGAAITSAEHVSDRQGDKFCLVLNTGNRYMRSSGVDGCKAVDAVGSLGSK